MSGASVRIWRGRILAVLGLTAAGGSLSLAAQAFPDRPPRPAPLSPVRFPPFKEATLGDGLQLVVIERHEQPAVSVSLSFRAGALHDPAGKEGLAALVAELLSKGTDTRSAEQIAATIEGVGGSLSADAGEDFLTISADALSDQVDLVFDLLGDVTLHSTFPETELELARTRALSALALELSQPASLASRFFAHEIYGHNPYGRRPTRESFRAVTRDDVTGFVRERLRPAGALLVVAGDVTEEQVRAAIGRAFAGWRGAPPAAASFPAPPTKASSDILLVHRGGSAQSNIVLGNTTILPSDPVYYAGRVATQVLGGGADARLFLILREQKGWTYGAYAGMRRYRGPGYWEATAEVRTEVTDSALAELLHQVDRIRTDAPPDSELTAARGFLVGGFPLTIETPEQIAVQVANAKLLGLGDDYLRLYRERLNAVTGLQARTAAARLYHRNALTIIVVGDGAKLYDRLKAIAPVRMVDADGQPLTPGDLTASPGTVVLDTAQFVARSDSSRVLREGASVGFTVSVVEHSRDSLRYIERSNLGNGVFQQQTTIVLDPTDGAVRQVDQVTTQQGLKTETHVGYGGGRVKGTSAAVQPDGSVKQFAIDSALAPGTIDENAVPFVIPALPLAAGKSFSLGFFAPSSNTGRVLTFKVTAPINVTVAAGTFPAYQVDVTGSRVPFTVYVATDQPRRILKTEFVGQPFVVELVQSVMGGH